MIEQLNNGSDLSNTTVVMIADKTAISEGPEAILAVHDVMPETLDRVEEILSFCRQYAIPPLTLFVVPGRDWTIAQIDRLHELSDSGYELAAHGWYHEVDEYRDTYHRIHGAILSRKAAEHLSYNQQEIIQLMQRSYEWFLLNSLPAPTLYVPPAWALGSVSRTQLVQLPFEQIEILRGVIDVKSNRLRILPLVGFEADTIWRAFFLRIWNAGQVALARVIRQPLRIGLHPQDFHLRLRETLTQFILQPYQFRRYKDIFLSAEKFYL